MLLDLMLTEKHLSNLYNHGVLEATSSAVSNTFERLQADTYDNARAIFTAMQQRGWYNVEQTERNERQPRGRSKQITDTFDQTADSKYAVKTGAKGFGGRLSNGQRQGKSGIYNNNQPPEAHYPKWQ
jgi:hypothetical protein